MKFNLVLNEYTKVALKKFELIQDVTPNLGTAGREQYDMTLSTGDERILCMITGHAKVGKMIFGIEWIDERDHMVRKEIFRPMACGDIRHFSYEKSGETATTTTIHLIIEKEYMRED